MIVADDLVVEDDDDDIGSDKDCCHMHNEPRAGEAAADSRQKLRPETQENRHPPA